MKKFIITSTSFIGKCCYTFNDANTLIAYDNDSNMNETQLQYLAKHIPIDVNSLYLLQRNIKGSTMVEAPIDISFDAFWERYDHKVNRKRCEPLYKKISDEDKALCISRVIAYKQYCERTGRGIADPEKYLSARYFDTNWRALK